MTQKVESTKGCNMSMLFTAFFPLLFMNAFDFPNSTTASTK
uniref:Uncharacterized protein n=1 Tax=Rhizophora mucronata TaxID=61149 RepID=A0A2P2IWQ0_RHIMU